MTTLILALIGLLLYWSIEAGRLRRPSSVQSGPRRRPRPLSKAGDNPRLPLRLVSPRGR